ncbi:MAG: glutamate racemase [Sphingobacteriales bacterium]|jgi:glutamate racemase
MKKIGIFDSGIGGLTLAHALVKINPNISFCYYGDTAHLPYGDKTPELVRYYSHAIVDFLLNQGCDGILIACNTASASAFDSLKATLPDGFPIFNVIDPIAEHIRSHYGKKDRIGVIGTRGTIASNIYQKRIRANNINAPEVFSKATPLLAPMIEEGFYDNSISLDLINNYINTPEFESLQAIILGCTHYPLIKDQVSAILGKNTAVIDSAHLVAAHICRVQEITSLSSEKDFFVSDLTDAFQLSAQHFFQEMVPLEERDIWGHNT